MEILYLLIPLSTALVLLILVVFGWALHGGQFEDLDREGERILHEDDMALDAPIRRPDRAARTNPVGTRP